MRVALLGSYTAGNFGDDLMAVMLASFLKENDVAAIIYGDSPPLCRSASCEVSCHAPEALKNVDICIFGGGSLLAAKNKMPPAYHESKRKAYHTIVQTLIQNKTPLWFISIGGDGSQVTASEIGDYREALLALANCRGATVRLPSDVDTLCRYHIRAIYYPDIVLSVSKFFPIREQGDGGKRTVCVNLPSQFLYLKWYIRSAMILNSTLAITFLESHHNAFFSGREMCWTKESTRRKNLAYTSVSSTLSHIQNCVGVVTPKLHLGVAALAYRVPYILIGRSPKALRFLETMPHRCLAYTKGRLALGVQLFRDLVSVVTTPRVRCGYDWGIVERYVKESWYHFTFISDVVLRGKSV